jgi:hypothetical protein
MFNMNRTIGRLATVAAVALLLLGFGAEITMASGRNTAVITQTGGGANTGVVTQTGSGSGNGR